MRPTFPVKTGRFGRFNTTVGRADTPVANCKYQTANRQAESALQLGTPFKW